jgi:hypothetical protein
VYLAGATDGALPGETNLGSCDAYLRLYNTNLAVQSTDQYGTARCDNAIDVAAPASGLYVAGSTSGTLPGETSAGGEDGYLRWYRPNGAIKTAQWGTAACDEVRGVAVVTGAVYVVGAIDGPLCPGRPANGDAFVAKYDRQLNLLWSRRFSTSGDTAALTVAADDSGAYVAGRTAGAFPGETSAGGLDAFVRKYTADGSVAWTAQFGAARDDGASSVAAAGGAIYVAGSMGRDAFIRKFSADGIEDLAWQQRFGTGSNDAASAVVVTTTNVYVAGTTAGAFPGQVNRGGRDVFVRKFDLAGGELWTQQLGTTGDDVAIAATVDASGLYVAGTTSGAFPRFANAGDNDVFIAKFIP